MNDLRRWQAIVRESMDISNSPEFRAWFGDSKVVDARGRPLRVYHGAAGGKHPYHSGGLIFFTDEPDVASDFAGVPNYTAPQENDWQGGTVFPAYLRIIKPLDPSQFSEQERTAISTTWGDEILEALLTMEWAVIEQPEFLKWLHANGYDGFIANEGGGITYAVFARSQIRSAL